VVRIDRNTVTISADSSGEALHRRAWRTDTVRAPLRTTMAAALLLGAGWDPTTSLVDPFCGSGTIGIEAALLARGLPPGGDRPFAFQDWPDFEPGSWASVVATTKPQASPAAQAEPPAEPSGAAAGPRLLLADRDEAAVAAARANAERAGVADDIEFATQVVSHLRARPGPGLVASNPPYGKRLGRDQMTGLYGRFGSVVRERLPGYGLALITSDPDLARAADGSLRPLHRFGHGGLSVGSYVRAPAEPAEPAEPPPSA
jgi:putative N6-adenine-specific DNA methylase